MKKFLIVFTIVLVFCCSIAIISNQKNAETGKDVSDSSTVAGTTNSKEDVSNNVKEKQVKISSDEYFEIVLKAIKDNVEPAGYKAVRSSTLRTPYYTVDCEADDLDISNFRNDVLEISKRIYDELIKYEYKMPNIFVQTHEIIDLSFKVIRDGEVISGLSVQFDLTDIDKDKSFQENLITPSP